MTSRSLLIIAASLLIGGSSLTLAQDAPAETRDPVAVGKRFSEIKSRLDEGGDLMVIANIEGLIEEQVGKLLGLMDAMPTDEPEAADVADIVKKVDAYLRKSGLYAINGFGISVVPQGDGMNNIKSFLSRDGAGRSVTRNAAGIGESVPCRGSLSSVVLPRTTGGKETAWNAEKIAGRVST